MLTMTEIHELAATKGIRVRNTWESTTEGKALPRLLAISLRFTEFEPELWAQLMTTPFPDFAVDVQGTRQVTSSGATDNTLYDCYAALLPEVNEKRKVLGYPEIYR